MKKVLIVEDDATLLSALAAGLKDAGGIGVLTAKEGNEGLEVAFREHPHLILLDLLMPKMDGITMLKKLREDEWGKDVKVIILTNLEDRDKVAEAIDSRVFDYLVKANWDMSKIVKKVQTELKYIG